MCVCWVTVFTAKDNEKKKRKVKTYISFHIFKFQAKRESEFREVLHFYLIVARQQRMTVDLGGRKHNADATISIICREALGTFGPFRIWVMGHLSSPKP